MILLLATLTLLQADPPLAVEIGHTQWECSSQTQARYCYEDDHFRIWLNGKELKDVPALTAKLTELSGGKSPIERKILLRPAVKTPFERVWPLIAALRKLNCVNLLWWEEAPAKKTDGAPKNSSDLVVRISGERLRGTEIRVGEGAWTKREAEAVAALQAAGGDPGTRLLFDVGADIPWADVSRFEEAFRAKGFGRIDFLFLPGLPGADRTVTAEDASSLAKVLEEASVEDQPAVFDRLLDRQELYRRVMGATVLSGRIRHLVAEMFAMVAPSRKLLEKSSPGQKPLRFLRMKGTRPLFRYLPSNGLDYLELILEKDAFGTPRIVDLVSATQNATATEAWRVVALSDEAKISILNKLRAPTPGDLVGFSNPAIDKLLALATQGKNEEAAESFRANVESLKKSEYALKIYLNVSRRIGPDAFIAALTEYEKHFPQSTLLRFMWMESQLVKGDREKAMAAIDALDQWVGGDPYLDLMRARAHSDGGDFQGALGWAEKATQREPALAVGWWNRVAFALQMKDYKALAAGLTGIEEKLGQPVGEIEKEPDFAEFVKSEEFRRWASSRKKK